MVYASYLPPLPNDASAAERIACRNDEPDVTDWKFRRPILGMLPERFGMPIARRYTTIHQEAGRRDANLYLLDVKDKLGGHALKLAASDDELIAFAKARAEEFTRLRYMYRNPEDALRHLCTLASEHYKVVPPLRHRNSKGTGTVSVTVREVFTETTDRFRINTLSQPLSACRLS